MARSYEGWRRLVAEAHLRVMECLVAGRPLAVPVSAVTRVIEYTLASALPFFPDWACTLGLHEGEPVLSVDVARRAVDRGEARGVLLAGAAGLVPRVLRVDRVVGFVPVRAEGPRAVKGEPAWVKEHARLGGLGSGENAGALLVVDPRALGAALETA